MVKKLRLRFIATSMSAVALVLFIFITSVNVANYVNVLYSADIRLSMLEKGGGKIPMPDLFQDIRGPLSAESPFDSRFFSVLVSDDGSIITVDTSHIAAIEKAKAVSMTQSLIRKNKSQGIIGDYAFSTISTGSGTLYIFLDHSRELDTFYSFLTVSICFALFLLLLVFVPVIIFSKTAIKPIIESYEKQKIFITDAGHELKTPLSVIKAANEVIEIESGESKWTQSINNQVNKMTKLTNKLILLSRMSEENGLEFKSFSISSALKECLEGFDAVGFSRDKEIRSYIEDNVMYSGDEKAISQLFTLLTDNAMKYSLEKTPVTVSLKKSGKNTEIIFFNYANNVKPGNNDILFERFYRPDSDRASEKGGTGIGLSVAKAIVDAHKGKITAYSSDGKSFSVKITL